ncbi:MAG: glycosyltransferase [Anaerolineales bacterium]
MPPAIVIPAYNRPQALSRLVNSLLAADYPPAFQVPLVISIDPENGTPNQGVREIAESFRWIHGPKEIILHPEHLGMLNNFYFCGNLTETYDSVIYLEDDLVLSPVFYHFVQQAHQYFSEDTRIAGISLYAYQFNGYHHYPFIPLMDGADVYFAQIMSILGQSWTKAQWSRFTQWRASRSRMMNETGKPLHDIWQSFAGDEYFPIQMKYLVSTDQFYLFPRVSLTTGFGDQGVHFDSDTDYFQVPLQRNKTSYRFHALDDADALYDSFMEPSPERLRRLVPSLRNLNFDVDLNATKELRHLTAEHVITTRICNDPLKSFALAMQPPEANLIFEAQGTGINLCRPSDLRWDRWSEFQTRKRLHDYFARGSRTSLKRAFVYYLFDFIQRFKS